MRKNCYCIVRLEILIMTIHFVETSIQWFAILYTYCLNLAKPSITPQVMRVTLVFKALVMCCPLSGSGIASNNARRFYIQFRYVATTVLIKPVCIFFLQTFYICYLSFSAFLSYSFLYILNCRSLSLIHI